MFTSILEYSQSQNQEHLCSRQIHSCLLTHLIWWRQQGLNCWESKSRHLWVCAHLYAWPIMEPHLPKKGLDVIMHNTILIQVSLCLLTCSSHAQNNGKVIAWKHLQDLYEIYFTLQDLTLFNLHTVSGRDILAVPRLLGELYRSERRFHQNWKE